MLFLQLAAARENDGPLDHVAQFAYIALPVAGAELVERGLQGATTRVPCLALKDAIIDSTSGAMSSVRSRSGGRTIWNTAKR